MIVPSSQTRTVTVRIACVAMVAGGLGTLTAAVEPGRWLAVSVLAVAIVAAAVGLLRGGSRNAAVPTVVGLALSVLALAVGYGGPGGRFSLVLDGGTVERLVATAHEAVSQANGSFPPMASSAPIEMLLVAGGLVVYLLLDAVAAGLRAPAWSGLVAISLWVPTTVLGLPAPWWGFAISATGYLMLLAASTSPATNAPSSVAERARVTSLTARYIAGVAATTLLVAPGEVNGPALSAPLQPPAGGGVILDRDGNLVGLVVADDRVRTAVAGTVPVSRYAVLPADRLAGDAAAPAGLSDSSAAALVAATRAIIVPITCEP